jgi:putative addiction module component (TIGR02574 family)
MDVAATLSQIARLPVEERIRLVHAIWDSIAEDQLPPDLSEEQKRELDRRLAELDANPDNVLTWEEIKARIKGKP